MTVATNTKSKGASRGADSFTITKTALNVLTDNGATAYCERIQKCDQLHHDCLPAYVQARAVAKQSAGGRCCSEVQRANPSLPLMSSSTQNGIELGGSFVISCGSCKAGADGVGRLAAMI